jgi:hypothetical protein
VQAHDTMKMLKINLCQEHWETLSYGSTATQLLTPWQMATLLVESYPQWWAPVPFDLHPPVLGPLLPSPAPSLMGSYLRPNSKTLLIWQSWILPDAKLLNPAAFMFAGMIFQLWQMRWRQDEHVCGSLRGAEDQESEGSNCRHPAMSTPRRHEPI